MKRIKLFLIASVLLIGTYALADSPIPFVETPTGTPVKTVAWLITTTEAEGRIEYAVIVKGDAGDWHVIPAILQTALPDGILGRPSGITGTVEVETEIGHAPFKRVNITDIQPVGW